MKPIDGSNRFRSGRHAGLLLPLFAAPTRQSWGIGEVSDLPRVCEWLKAAGLDFLQVLPLTEMPADQHSPYSAVSAMAIDPIFISLRDLPDFEALGGEGGLPPDARRDLEAARRSSRVRYELIRPLKMQALRAAFARFREAEWIPHSDRARHLREYQDGEAWWLDDYALYRALRDRHQARPWWDWEPALAHRSARALRRARKALSDECLFYSYVQWVADAQWHDAKREASPVGVFGDVSFMVGSDSADVWAHQHAFRLDATVGAPPDAFSETGQNWELPVYRWDVFAAENDAWIRERAARNASLFDGYRVDHLVGFYRTYVIPVDGSARAFSPATRVEQLAQGERVMHAFLESGARITAEDLGTVPDFVRGSLVRLGIPGYKVLRWEREWSAPGRPFKDPAHYTTASVATTGTHDTETLVDWWERAPLEERTAVARIPFFASRSLSLTGPACDAATRDSLLEALAASSSDLLILPVQDVFGWHDRINVPATVSDENWRFRLPWPADDLAGRPDALERADTLSRWMRRYRRSALPAAPEAESTVQAEDGPGNATDR